MSDTSRRGCVPATIATTAATAPPPTTGSPWADLPERWRGVWQRTLLAAAGVHDTTTAVRWLQTATRHADLRVPAASRPLAGAPGSEVAWRQLAAQQGFFGRTELRTVGDRVQCWWHREHDFQPASALADAGWMAFDGADILIETGVHADYLEVWQRLPGSTGRHAVLARGPRDAERLLLAGDHLAWVRARPRPLPPCASDTLLADLLARVTAQERDAALDMPLVFGRWDGTIWHVEQASQPQWEGQRVALRIQAEGRLARVESTALPAEGWRMIEGSL